MPYVGHVAQLHWPWIRMALVVSCLYSFNHSHENNHNNNNNNNKRSCCSIVAKEFTTNPSKLKIAWLNEINRSMYAIAWVFSRNVFFFKLWYWHLCYILQVIRWIEEHGETFLKKHTGVGKSLVKAEALLRRHEEFENIAQVRWHIHTCTPFQWSRLVTLEKSHQKVFKPQPLKSKLNADFKSVKKKGCPEVVFEIFTVKHKHVNKFWSENYFYQNHFSTEKNS